MMKIGKIKCFSCPITSRSIALTSCDIKYVLWLDNGAHFRNGKVQPDELFSSPRWKTRCCFGGRRRSDAAVKDAAQDAAAPASLLSFCEKRSAKKWSQWKTRRKKHWSISRALEHFYRWNCGFEESENNSRRPVRGNKVFYYRVRDTIHITLPALTWGWDLTILTICTQSMQLVQLWCVDVVSTKIVF